MVSVFWRIFVYCAGSHCHAPAEAECASAFLRGKRASAWEADSLVGFPSASPFPQCRACSLPAAVLRASSCTVPWFSLPLHPLRSFSTFLISESHDASRKWTLQPLAQLCHPSALCLLAFSTRSRGQIMVPGEKTVIFYSRVLLAASSWLQSHPVSFWQHLMRHAED